jgi:signal transduction histidine kinase
VTDSAPQSAEWVEPLAQIARASGHELRNALNALVVNLEVVRSRVSDPATQPFAEQAVAQSEESVRLAEAAISLLNLVIGAVGPDGSLQCSFEPPGTVRVTPAPGELERAARGLRALADRGAVRVDTSDTTVILSIPKPSA